MSGIVNVVLLLEERKAWLDYWSRQRVGMADSKKIVHRYDPERMWVVLLLEDVGMDDFYEESLLSIGDLGQSRLGMIARLHGKYRKDDRYVSTQGQRSFHSGQ